MRKKLTAYDISAKPQLNNMVKCSECSFHCILAQVEDNQGKCPRCNKQMR